MWQLHRQGAGGIVGDEMGLGKTVQVCAIGEVCLFVFIRLLLYRRYDLSAFSTPTRLVSIGFNPPTGVSLSWSTPRQQRDATRADPMSSHSPLSLDGRATRLGTPAESGVVASLRPGI